MNTERIDLATDNGISYGSFLPGGVCRKIRVTVHQRIRLTDPEVPGRIILFDRDVGVSNPFRKGFSFTKRVKDLFPGRIRHIA